MDTSKIIKALRLEPDAAEGEVLARIADLTARAAAAEDEADTLIDRIGRGEHDQVAVNADGSLTMTLLYPLKSGTETIGQLEIQRPKFKHLRASDGKGRDGSPAKGDIEKTQAILAAVTSRSPRELEEMDQEDIAVASACLGFFSRNTRRTGAVS